MDIVTKLLGEPLPSSPEIITTLTLETVRSMLREAAEAIEQLRAQVQMLGKEPVA